MYRKDGEPRRKAGTLREAAVDALKKNPKQSNKEIGAAIGTTAGYVENIRRELFGPAENPAYPKRKRPNVCYKKYGNAPKYLNGWGFNCHPQK